MFDANCEFIFDLYLLLQEELDTKVLKFQNAKLYSKLEEKNILLEELNAKVSELDRLRANDQTIISILNVAWNQVFFVVFMTFSKGIILVIPPCPTERDLHLWYIDSNEKG